MRIRNIDPEPLRLLIDTLGICHFAYVPEMPDKFGQWFNVRFVPRRDELYKQEHGHYRYQRRSASAFRPERRVHALCWHGHLHLFRAIFERFPKTEIHTALAKRIYGNKLSQSLYTAENFENLFPNTGRINIGSHFQPVNADEACFCSETGDDYWERRKPDYSEIEKRVATPNDPTVKTVRQKNLSAECWLVQVWGKGQCETCEVRDTPECGGQNILKTGKNEKGLEVPIS